MRTSPIGNDAGGADLLTGVTVVYAVITGGIYRRVVSGAVPPKRPVGLLTEPAVDTIAIDPVSIMRSSLIKPPVR